MQGKRPTMQTAIVRVIGGTLRGRRLRYALEPGTRPMKDRVREAVFNLLGPGAVAGTVAWDLFAGTGALAVEAISRGAIRAVALERNWRMARQLQQHARTLSIDDRLSVVAGGDTLEFQDWPPAGPEPWLVFCCPPYAMYREDTPRLMRVIGAWQAHAPAGSFVVVETDMQFDRSQLPGRWPWRHREYPPAVVAWTQKDPQVEPAIR